MFIFVGRHCISRVISIFFIPVMLEGEADRVPLHKVEQALSQGIKATQTIVSKITELREALGKPKRVYESPRSAPTHVLEAVERCL